MNAQADYVISIVISIQRYWDLDLRNIVHLYAVANIHEASTIWDAVTLTSCQYMYVYKFTKVLVEFISSL